MSRVVSDRTPDRMERVKTRETIAEVTAMESIPWRSTIVSTEEDWELRGGLATLKKTAEWIGRVDAKGWGWKVWRDDVSFRTRMDFGFGGWSLFRGMREE